MKTTIHIIILLFLFSSIQAQELGIYFSKKEYLPEEIPTWENSEHLLPKPILEGNPGWIDMYWKCWEIAFHGMKQPPNGSPLVSNWLDEAFSENIFQWDTIFMLMFARYGHNVFPAIESLDNFYRLQYESGFIGREFRESDGKLIHFDFDGGLFSEKGWKNMINPPLFSWAEVESFKVTGDKSRFELILPVLEKYAEWLNRDGDPDAIDWEMNGRISKTAEHKLYWNTPLGSGMDNTPRPAEKGAGWVEMSAQMVLMYRNLAVICDELGYRIKAEKYRKEAQAIGDRINKWCWNDEDGFYYDVTSAGEQFKKKSIGGFWPLLAEVASKEQAEKLVEHLTDENEFWRKNVFPTLAADEEEYHEIGDYWRGGVWAPTNVMVIKGLEKYGFEKLAYIATEKYLNAMHQVFVDSNTVYENYAPDHFLPGDPSRPDFVGWTGCGPIQLLFENIMGLRPNGTDNKIVWNIQRTDHHGVENLIISDNQISLIIEEKNDDEIQREINVSCQKPFTLTIIDGQKEMHFELKSGKQRIYF
jgi:glycogen debranching enzyme